jgi:hypothetical protein
LPVPGSLNRLQKKMLGCRMIGDASPRQQLGFDTRRFSLQPLIACIDRSVQCRLDFHESVFDTTCKPENLGKLSLEERDKDHIETI